MLKWIGVPSRKNGIETAYFRHEFNLEKIEETIISISAADRYRLYVNGCPVNSGPCRGDKWTHYFDNVDITRFLTQGDNVIAVKVVSYIPRELVTETQAPPAWIYTAALGPCLYISGEAGNHSFTTGITDWMVSVDETVEWAMHPMSSFIGSLEQVHGEKLPKGWNEVGKPMGYWIKADEKWDPVLNPYGEIKPLPLKERPIPLLYEAKKTFKNMQSDLLIKAGESVSIELDAGELTTGYFNIKTKGGKNGSIKITYAECYFTNNEKKVRDDSKNGELIGYSDIYFPSGGDDTYEPFLMRTFRYVKIEAEAGETDLIINPPHYLETGYPLEVKSETASSEAWIKDLWDISITTLKRCMHETYEDCPYFEQLQYTMDTRLQMLFTYMVSGDTRLAKRTIFDYNASLLPEGILQSRYPCNFPQVIPSFALHWIFMLEDYYIQTGDKTVLQKYRSTVDSVLEWFDRKLGKYGLVENLGYWDYCDWVKEWTDGVPNAVKHGPSTIHNLVYAYALKIGANIFRITEREETALEYENRSSTILSNIENYCWSEKEGLYKEGPNFEEYTQHAQVWAVLCDLATGQKAKDILTKALERKDLLKCSFPQMFYFFRALEKADMYDKTAELWDLWKDFLPLHVTTWPETPYEPRSDCHAWGSLPLYEFTRNILGVNPMEAGWEKIIIAPKCINLHDAEGIVTTPKGDVKVKWENGDKFSLKCTVPSGIYTQLVLPDNTVINYPNGGIIEI